MRSRFIALPIATLAALAITSVAIAGNWAQVSAAGPIDPVAGEETTIELTVLQHGETAVSWPSLNVVATEAESGAVVRAEAEATDTAGLYRATLVFPTVGEWTLAFESADLVMDGSVRLDVAPAATAAIPATASTGAFGLDLLAVLLVTTLAAVALAGAFLYTRTRATNRGRHMPA
jgi:hypothetical protein